MMLILNIKTKINNDNGDKLVDIPISKFVGAHEEISYEDNYVVMANCNGKIMPVRGFICYGDPLNKT